MRSGYNSLLCDYPALSFPGFSVLCHLDDKCKLKHQIGRLNALAEGRGFLFPPLTALPNTLCRPCAVRLL